MLSLDFDGFMRGEYDDSEPYQLYIVKNGDDVLYVGISRTGIWNRWFGWSGRMHKNAGGYWFGSDAISIEISEHMPESLKYTIELYSIDELFELLKDEIGDKYIDTTWRKSAWRLNDLEALMIEKLHPFLNVMGNRWERDLHPEENDEAQRRAVYLAFGETVIKHD